MSIEKVSNEVEEDDVMTAKCKVIDYPGDVNKLLNKLSYKQQTDWEFVNKLQVVHGKYSLSPLYIFYLEGENEVEVWDNGDYSWDREYEAKDQILEVMDRIIRANGGEVVK